MSGASGAFAGSSYTRADGETYRSSATSATPSSPVLERQVTNHQLPGWARVWVWCLANADRHGHARAYPGELRQVLDANSREVSRAIRLARERGVIDGCSNAGCLVLPGFRNAPCPAIHRGGA